MSDNNRVAVVILHEIYGINAHIRRVRQQWQARGFDVFTPALFPHLTPFNYAQQTEAYHQFSNHVGFEPTAVISLLGELRTQYTTLIVVGYSVGATLAWLAARSGLCDGVICHYGSRIRQYSDIAPSCPTLVIIARHEPAFDTGRMQQALEKRALVHCHLFDAHHGFCDPYSPTFDARLAYQAAEEVWAFTDDILARSYRCNNAQNRR